MNETLSPVLRTLDALVDSVDKSDMSMVVRINTSCLDKFNTAILAKGGKFKNWRNAGMPVLWEHGKDVHRRFTDPIANSKGVWNNGGPNPTEILAEPKFLTDDFARQRYEWYRDSVIRGWSVNVLPVFNRCSPPTQDELRMRPDWEGASVIYREWDLNEFSGTVLPGNPEAVTSDRAAKVLEFVQRNQLWLPDEAQEIYEKAAARTMTECGGMSTGGALVKPEYKDDDDNGKVQVAVGASYLNPADTPAIPAEPYVEMNGSDDQPMPAKSPEEPPAAFTPSVAPTKVQEIDSEDASNADIAAPARKRTIQKVGSEYVIFSEKGKRLGRYKSKDQARKRLQQIEYFKHQDQRAVLVPDTESYPDPDKPASHESLQRSSGNSDKIVKAIKAAIAKLPKLFPDYGHVLFNPDNGNVWIVSSDSDDGPEVKVWIDALSKVDGVTNVDAEAESWPSGHKSWIRINERSLHRDVLSEDQESYPDPDETPEPESRSATKIIPVVRTVPYIDTDEGSWFVRRADGSPIVHYTNAADAEAALHALQNPKPFEDVYAAVVNQQRAAIKEVKEFVIALQDLYLRGVV